MNKIPIYNITRLQQQFSVTDFQKDYFLILPDQFKAPSEEPFRTETYGISLLKEGSLILHSGMEQTRIVAPAVLTMGPQVIRRLENTREEPTLELIFFTETFLTSGQTNVFFLDKYPFFSRGSHVLPLTSEGFQKFNTIYNLIEEVLRGQHPHEGDIVKSYIRILINEIDFLYRNQAGAGEKEPVSSNPLLNNFNVLLNKEFLTHRSISFYADKLAVTPKYLSEYVKQQTGQTAGEWIDKAVILEAKVLLQRKDLSISQISTNLSFVDQSVFGKFFKSKTGLSPKAFRASVT